MICNAQGYFRGIFRTGGKFGRIVRISSRAGARVPEGFAHTDPSAHCLAGTGLNGSTVDVVPGKRGDPISLKRIPVPIAE